MNRTRRQQLFEAISILNKANSMVEFVCDDEQDSINNLPENLQETERCCSMEDAVDDLQDAQNSLNDAIASIQSAASRR